MEEIKRNLQRFADDHKLIFEDKGEIGFGRPCVGFTKGDTYIAYNPHKSDGDYESIKEFYDERWWEIKPEDAYHKDDYVAVLVNNEDYDKALTQLNNWVNKMEEIGVEVAQFNTGARGMQAVLTGLFGHTFKLKSQ